MDHDDEALSMLTAIIGADTQAEIGHARSLLQVTDYNVEAAANLYFASGPPDITPAPSAQPTSADPYAALSQYDHLGTTTIRSRDRASDGGDAPPEVPSVLPPQPSSSYPMEEGVRAPDPVRRESLYTAATRGGRHSAGRYEPPPPQEVNAFRDFRAEMAEEGPISSGRQAESQGLAGLFAAPRDIMTPGTFEAALHRAQTEQRWLLINLQSNEEFASHMLNRDTWTHAAVKKLIQATFVFWQTQVSATNEEAHKVVSFYRVQSLPSILLVDPVTGACLQSFQGFVEADRLLEELMPYRERGIHDAPSKHRRPGPGQPSKQPKRMTEEEELALALQASAAEAGSSQPEAAPAQPAVADPRANGHSSVPEAAEEPMQGQGQPGDPAAASSAVPSASEDVVPEEPSPDDKDVYFIKLRLANGRPFQRSYLPSSHIKALHAVCRAELPEAQTRAFQITDPNSKSVLDPSQTLQTALQGHRRVLLAMQWAD